MPMIGTIASGNITFHHLGGLAVIRIDKMPAESGTLTDVEIVLNSGTVNQTINYGTLTVDRASVTAIPVSEKK